MNVRGALRGTPGGACPHSPSQMPLLCPVAPPSKREQRKDGGGGGGGVARRARAARAPKAKPCATPCGTSFATSLATSFAASFTCSSFTFRPRAAWGSLCVRWVWVPALEGGNGKDKHPHAPILRGALHVLRHFLCHVLRHVLRRVLYVLVRHVSPKGSVGAACCVGRGFRRWKMARATVSIFAPPSFTAPSTSSATSCATSSATSFTCLFFTCHPMEDDDGQDNHLYAPVLRGAQHVLRHVLCRVLHVFVLHVSPPTGKRGGRHACVGRGFRCWKMTMERRKGRSTMNTFALPSFAAPRTSSAPSCAKFFTCGVQKSGLKKNRDVDVRG